jgi:hypothetical protein
MRATLPRMMTRGITQAAVLLLLLSGCGDGDEPKAKPSPSASTPSETPIELAARICGSEPVGLDDERGDTYLDVEDEGHTVTVSGGDKYSTPPIGFCLLERLDAPASTTRKVEGTTALMGQLNDQFGDYEVTWSYHPDNGLDMVITDNG